MEFVAAKKDFAQALAKAQGIPETKNMSSVMANVLLESVDSGTVRLTAQSYEVTLVVSFPAQVVTPGRLALSGRTLLDSARMLPEAPVTVKAQPNSWAELVAGRTAYKVPGILPENMPEAQVPQTAFEVRLPRDLLSEIAERVGFAMSQDEGRPNLNGIFLKATPEGEGARIEAVATDSHRLSRLVRNVDAAGLGEGVRAILHRKGITELRRFLDDTEDEVYLGFQRSAVVVRTPAGYLLVRQIELEYPDYQRVIPSEFKWRFSLDRQEFIGAVRRAQVVISSDKTPLVRLRLAAGRLEVMAQDPERGDATSELDVAYDGEPLDISYNNRYLMDALVALTGQEALVSIRDQASASILSNPEDPGLLQLIMPVRV
ncbi:MAG TPA: DNA polymerase III subunit beta [Myxococcota bacterium]|jgi:DNA polymerase-3 subunit beta|nr:DNA polymerase III subunit beta [Myxococcota bacterium]